MRGSRVEGAGSGNAQGLTFQGVGRFLGIRKELGPPLPLLGIWHHPPLSKIHNIKKSYSHSRSQHSYLPMCHIPKGARGSLCPVWVIIPPVNPLDDYSYTPPYTPPSISLRLPHYQYKYRNNQLPHLYSLRWHYFPNWARGSLQNLVQGFGLKVYNYGMTLLDTPYFLGNSSRTHSPKTFRARSAHPSPTPSTETGHGVLGPRLGSEAHQDSSSSLFVTALSLPPAFCQIGTGFSFAERFLVGQEHRVLHAAVPLRTASLVGKLELAKTQSWETQTPPQLQFPFVHDSSHSLRGLSQRQSCRPHWGPL